MLKNVPFCSRRLKQSGWTLVEMLVATAISTIIMASLMTVMLFALRSFMAVGNYGELNQSSRYALDLINRDIRNATAVSSYAADGSSITLTNMDKSRVSYSWDSNATTMTRTFIGSSTISRVLLTNCDSLVFTLYQNNPTVTTNGITFSNTATAGQAKIISVQWVCSRKIMGAKQNTESVQTAQVTMRN